MKRHPMFDTSEELLVQRWKNGVRLVRPTLEEERVNLPSVSDLFAMPFNAYFLNTQSVLLNVSETAAHICGFQERKEAFGSTVLRIFKKESAELILRHDYDVLSSKSISFQEMDIVRLDDFTVHRIEVKFLLLNTDGKTIGIFSCTIIQEVAQSFHQLMNAGLLATTSVIENPQSNVPIGLSAEVNPQEMDALGKKLSEKFRQFISKREVGCLFYLIRGKTARETGMILNLSRRTVEFYLDSLKDKLNCRKKSDIIENVFGLLRH